MGELQQQTRVEVLESRLGFDVVQHFMSTCLRVFQTGTDQAAGSNQVSPTNLEPSTPNSGEHKLFERGSSAWL
jgi:hypothetical protein